MPNFVAVSVTCNATGNVIIVLHGETCMPWCHSNALQYGSNTLITHTQYIYYVLLTYWCIIMHFTAVVSSHHLVGSK